MMAAGKISNFRTKSAMDSNISFFYEENFRSIDPFYVATFKFSYIQ